MTETVRTPAPLASAGEIVDDLEGGLLEGGLDLRAGDIFDRIWHFFISMRTGLVLILLLALLTLAGTLLAQAPAGVLADPQAHASWLDSVRAKYGGWTSILDALGLFAAFSSIWFRGLVILLTTSIVACSVHRAPHLWRQAMHPRVRMTDAFYRHAALHVALPVDAAGEDAAAALRRAWGAQHFRTVAQEADGLIHVYADKFRWGPFGTVIAHLSLVLILVGALLGTNLGFRDTEFAVAVGSTAAVGHDTGLSIAAKSFTDSYYPDGSPSDYASDIVLYRDGQQVAAQTIRVNQPLSYGDVTVYQSYFGAAAAMTVKDASGKVLYDEGVPLEWQSSDGNQSIGQFVVPGKGLSVYVVGAASGKVDPNIKAGQVQVEVYSGAAQGTPVAVQTLDQGKPVTVEGLEFTFQREREFTGLIVAKDPGAPFVWAGALFLVLGVCLVFLLPHRRAWAVVRPDGRGSLIEVGSTARHDVAFEKTFQTLARDLTLALGGPGAS